LYGWDLDRCNLSSRVLTKSPPRGTRAQVKTLNCTPIASIGTKETNTNIHWKHSDGKAQLLTAYNYAPRVEKGGGLLKNSPLEWPEFISGGGLRT